MNGLTGVDEYGVTDGFHDNDGRWHPTSDVARAALHAAIGRPEGGPPLWFVPVGATPDLMSPCHLTLDDGRDFGVVGRLPGDTPIGYHDLRPLDGGPTTRLIVHPERCPDPPTGWGVAMQLYAAMSNASQGIGDLADLVRLAGWVERQGGRVVLLSPLHAPAPGRVQQDSPYYPATRRWLNPLHLRVPGVPAQRVGLVDRDQVWAEKRAALWELFEQQDADQEAEWRRWTEAQGESLAQWATWCAHAEGTPTEPVHDFHAWLQWCMVRQLAAVHTAAPGVAIIGDLAIGFDPSGADAADFAAVLATGCRIGAPPDGFNPAGQDWGLPPFSPWRLRAACYEPFIQTVRGAIAGLHGLRIDHVMGLFRQYWIPAGLTGQHGAYVRFPSEELLAILAIEATRAGAFVIGEDLGTVEPYVREALQRYNIWGTVVTWFEDRPPAEYPTAALATVTTHDLPTVAGVWRSLDGDDQLRARLTDLVDPETDSIAAVVIGIHEQLARAPSSLKLVTTDDLCLAEQRPNVPGTTIERPNWKLPLPLSLEELERSSVAERIAAALDRRG